MAEPAFDERGFQKATVRELDGMIIYGMALLGRLIMVNLKNCSPFVFRTGAPVEQDYGIGVISWGVDGQVYLSPVEPEDAHWTSVMARHFFSDHTLDQLEQLVRDADQYIEGDDD
jgi:hypothetical protein